jgi:NitT/TauT family transport system ATP-binding protein
MQPVIIRAEQVEKYYPQPSENRIQVISPTDLSISAGEIVALLGPSGSGKSTLLRMLTGLSAPSAGTVYWHEKPIVNAEVNVSIVFQSFALFPWLTVRENVEAPLKARGMEAAERRKRSLKILDTVGLDGFQAAYPKELSGGMRQRVGFARALVVEPEVLFMDEPFSALDVQTRQLMENEVLGIWAEKRKAVLFITHDLDEAIAMSDRVVCLSAGPASHPIGEFEVDLPRPRDVAEVRATPRFVELHQAIWSVLREEVLAGYRQQLAA